MHHGPQNSSECLPSLTTIHFGGVWLHTSLHLALYVSLRLHIWPNLHCWLLTYGGMLGYSITWIPSTNHLVGSSMVAILKFLTMPSRSSYCLYVPGNLIFFIRMVGLSPFSVFLCVFVGEEVVVSFYPLEGGCLKRLTFIGAWCIWNPLSVRMCSYCSFKPACAYALL